ncbi:MULTISPECIES: ABC transporter permease [Haloferax]|uniref:FtsX-like permease family protein n=1 Tax=Haloferax marinum TaxID=2666143 RepID=A0A6A8GAL7_9EURY|nr:MULTISPECIES: ABC transporter permease [Haloferax]KAB1198223.1 ABC transporter permease [Haloferax sp. CBA1150]MRW97313.1 FtsX-like permease family protein [Haloferax marinum]
MIVLSRLRAVIGIASAQIRHQRLRSILAVVGICLAVLSMTLLTSLGAGVVQTGQEKFDTSGRDLWVTGGPVRLTPETGGFQNSLDNSHQVADEITARDDVKNAAALGFQTVYVSPNQSEFETIIGVGAPSGGQTVTVTEGSQYTSADKHYAGGSYDGPMTHEVIISPETAEQFDVGVNDTLYIGSTLVSAKQNEFRITGISPTYSNFLGTRNVVMHLSELQEISGTTGTDTASLVTVALQDGADPETVASEIEAQYPTLDVRTNQEQLEATLRRQAVLIAAGVSLVVLSIVTGIALTLNLVLSLIYQQRREFAALRAQGLSVWTLVGVVGTQAFTYGIFGGALAAGLTYPLADFLNIVIERLVGFEGVVAVDQRIVIGGFAIALVIGMASAFAGSWSLARQPVTDLLDN